MPSSCAGQASELLTPLPATLLAPMATIWACAMSAAPNIAATNAATANSLAVEIMLPSRRWGLVRIGISSGRRSNCKNLLDRPDGVARHAPYLFPNNNQHGNGAMAQRQ